MSNKSEITTPTRKTPVYQKLVIFLSFLVWGYYYLFTLRPALNRWLSQFVDGYPAMLHLFPILSVPVLIAVIISRVDQSKKEAE